MTAVGFFRPLIAAVAWRRTKWWCDCDDVAGPHVHCTWGGNGKHVHAADLPQDHRERHRG